jgi:branched-chain amino acid transport system ATP-binding protein
MRVEKSSLRDVRSSALGQTSARAGITRTWQGQELFDDLTVYENVRVAAERLGRWEVLGDVLRPRRRRALQMVDDALARFGLTHLSQRMPTQLGHAERKLVGVARAVVGEPRVICMDEPAAGLDAAESRQLGAHLRALAAEGLAILLVDHDIGLVLGASIASTCWSSERRCRGTPAEVRRNPRVIKSCLGEATTRQEVSA